MKITMSCFKDIIYNYQPFVLVLRKQEEKRIYVKRYCVLVKVEYGNVYDIDDCVMIISRGKKGVSKEKILKMIKDGYSSNFVPTNYDFLSRVRDILSNRIHQGCVSVKEMFLYVYFVIMTENYEMYKTTYIK